MIFTGEFPGVGSDMRDLGTIESIALGRRVGIVWLASLLAGITATILFGQGLDINLSADVEAMAVAMLDAETWLRALAYMGMPIFALDLLVSLGLFLLLRSAGPLLTHSRLSNL